MAKNTKREGVKQEPVRQAPAGVTVMEPHKYSIFDYRTQCIILALLGFVFYANSFSNEYAFDDMMVIVDNAYVQKGVAGIGDIMSHDTYQSYLEQRNGGNELSGGRYRPFSVVTFAIEQQILGLNADQPDNPSTAADRTPELERKLKRDMHIRHFLNVVLYILSLCTLLAFLRRVVFPGDQLAGFLAVLLFAIHPLHTEVVANVKSRDEILSVLFITLTLSKAFRYKESKKTSDLAWACILYFLALLSKEYGALLLVLMPVAFYVFDKTETVQSAAKRVIPFAIVFGVYFLLRNASVSKPMEGAETDIMNNPYFYATFAQKYATVIALLLTYLRMLVFPHPLVADYSFNQIPYVDFGNPIVWASILVHIGMVVAMALLIKKRHPLGFALAFYLVNLALVSNLFFNIGAPLGERLVYHSSIGFCIVIGWLLYEGYKKLGASTGSMVVGGAVGILVIVCAITTIARNPDWKNNNTLFLTDAKKSPNSALVNTNAGAACMMLAKEVGEGPKRKEWFEQAVGYFTQTIKINPKHYFAYHNRGLCEFNMGYHAKAVADWDTVRKYTPQQVNLDRYLDIAGKMFFNVGNRCKAEGKIDSAIFAFTEAAIAAPAIGEIWYNLGNTLYAAGRVHEAVPALEKAAKIFPNRPDVVQFYQQAKAMDK